MKRRAPFSLHRARRPWAAALTSIGLVAHAPCSANEPTQGDAQRGRALAEQFQCGRCHRIPDVAAARGSSAPSLVGFGTRSYIAGRLPNREALLARWIVEPAALVPGTTMPAMGANLAQARDIAAFLHTLR